VAKEAGKQQLRQPITHGRWRNC